MWTSRLMHPFGLLLMRPKLQSGQSWSRGRITSGFHQFSIKGAFGPEIEIQCIWQRVLGYILQRSSFSPISGRFRLLRVGRPWIIYIRVYWVSRQSLATSIKAPQLFFSIDFELSFYSRWSKKLADIFSRIEANETPGFISENELFHKQSLDTELRIYILAKPHP